MRKFLALVLLSLVSYPSFAEDGDLHSTTPTKVDAQFSVDKEVQQIVSRLSLRQKVGQLFIIGYNGTTLNQTLRNKIVRYNPGAIIAFKRNIKEPHQIAKLNIEAQRLSIKSSGLPLLIMVDQEGDTVTRIKSRPPPPSALSLGVTENTALTEEAGYITGQILSLLGFNMNLAPVVDLSDPFSLNFIGNRSFSNNPNVTTLLAERFVDGLDKANVLATLKHYPGHGGLIQDSHKSLPKKTANLDEIEKLDLIPFYQLAKSEHAPAIMVGHIAFPNIDPSGLPATFSKVLVNDILREKIKYPGLIITDDLEMTGAEVIGPIGERAIRAFEAGSDMVMVAWNPRSQGNAIESFVKAVEAGRISQERIDQSLKKIISIKLKHKYELHQAYAHKNLRSQLLLLLKGLKNVSDQVTTSNITKSLRGYSYLENALSYKNPLFVFSADGHFLKPVKQVYSGKTYFYPLSPKRMPNMSQLFAKTPNAIGIFYVSGMGTARRLSQLDKKTKSKLIVVNSTHPGVVNGTSDFIAVINTNSRNSVAGRSVVDYFFTKRKKSTHLRSPAHASNPQPAKSE